MAGKSHVKKKAGRKATKKKAKDVKKQLLGAGSSVLAGAGAAVAGLDVGGKKQKKGPRSASEPGANPKAFAFQSAGRAKAAAARTAEKEQRRLHAPMSERVVAEPPPLLVLVQGPPQVGKTSLIKGLVKHYTKQALSDPRGPITLVTGKRRRITLMECPPDLPGMMDAAKMADLVLLMIDGSFGLEMETFEFLNLLQVHGFPKVLGVLTHLDSFKEPSKLKKAKKALKARFWAEVYDGAKLFYLSGMQHGKYLKREVLNLARFISVAKTRPLSWRLDHPYLIADRMEDVTPAEPVRLNPKVDRDLLLYGYLRGAPLRPGSRLHLAGVGDFDLQEVDALPDPCPTPQARIQLFAGGGALPGIAARAISDGNGHGHGSSSDGDDADGDQNETSSASEDEEEDEEEDSDLDSEEDSDRQQQQQQRGVRMPAGYESVPAAGGRLRRRVLFDGGAAEAGGAGADTAFEGDEEEEGEDQQQQQDWWQQQQPRKRRRLAAGDDYQVDTNEQEEEEGEGEGMGAAAAWKSKIQERVASLFAPRGADLASFVYGHLVDLDARWSPDAVEGLRNRFVTGDWDAAAARAAAAAAGVDEQDGEEGEEEGDMFGDFEDVEAGLTFSGADAVTAAAQKAIADASAEELRAKKLSKRAAWDKGGKPGKPNPNRRDEDGESFFSSQKRDLAQRAAATAAALAQLDPHTRVAMAGHAVGTYVRLRLTGVPFELVQHWNPSRPLLVGGLGQGEQRMGVMRLRFKRHRWYPKVLKTRDPLVLSVGWRRFQTIPVYALEDHNRRLRSLKYTPQHCHCLAAVYAPLAPPNTVTEQEAELRIVKKLKLVGTPLKVHKHSAFVGGMFTSQLEASRFEGAAVTTVSGIRGTIKKALRAGVQGVPGGGVRVTFEDKPLLSDIVFLRAWVAVDIPKLREAGIGALRITDSLYRPIERGPRVFNPLKVPTKLQAALPFKSKPKLEMPRKRKTLEQKRAVVLEKDEKKAVSLLQQLNAIRNAKADKRRQQATRRREQHSKKQKQEQDWRDKYNKEQRKTRYVQQGQAAKRAAAAAEGRGGKGKKKQRRE
eukprot:gene7582-7787_t